MEPIKRQHGGRRPNSGRKKIGIGRVLKITLPTSEWGKIDSLIEAGYVRSASDYFRKAHEQYMKKN